MRKPVSKWDLQIGQKIKEARDDAHMTQAQLAKLVYKSQGNVSDFELGTLQINALDLFLIAHALEKPVAFFVPHPFYGPVKEGELPIKAQELFHYLYKIDDEERRDKILDLLIEQARRLVDVFLDADFKAEIEEIEAGLPDREKAKGKK